jgi:hypothetical protein
MYDNQDSIASGIIRKILSENINIDDLRKTIHTKTRKLTADIIDNLSSTVGTVIDRDLLDTLLVNDSQYKAFAYVNKLLDDIELADSVVRSVFASGSVNRILDENITITDNLVKDSNKERTLTDSADSADDIDKYIVRSRPLTSNAEMSDFIDRSVISAGGDRDRTLSEEIDLNDSLTKSIVSTGSKIRSLSDTITVVDDIVRLLQYERALDDQAVISEGSVIDVITFLQQSPDIFMDVVDNVPTSDNYNNLLFSEALSNRWQLTNGTISGNTLTSPFGPSGANRITSDINGAITFLYYNNDNYVRAQDTSLTFSIFAKQGNIAKFPLVIHNRTNNSTLAILKYNWSSELFDVITGDESSNASSHRVTFDNDFIRLGLTVTSGIFLNDIIELRAGFANATYSSGDYVDVFGAQLDTGENMMPYEKTLGLTLSTRSGNASKINTSIDDPLDLRSAINDSLNIEFKVA